MTNFRSHSIGTRIVIYSVITILAAITSGIFLGSAIFSKFSTWKIPQTKLCSKVPAQIAPTAECECPAYECPSIETIEKTNLDAASPSDYVIVISIDGLRADVISSLGSEKLPNFYKIINEGA